MLTPEKVGNGEEPDEGAEVIGANDSTVGNEGDMDESTDDVVVVEMSEDEESRSAASSPDTAAMPGSFTVVMVGSACVLVVVRSGSWVSTSTIAPVESIN